MNASIRKFVPEVLTYGQVRKAILEGTHIRIGRIKRPDDAEIVAVSAGKNPNELPSNYLSVSEARRILRASGNMSPVITYQDSVQDFTQNLMSINLIKPLTDSTGYPRSVVAGFSKEKQLPFIPSIENVNVTLDLVFTARALNVNRRIRSVYVSIDAPIEKVLDLSLPASNYGRPNPARANTASPFAQLLR